MLNIVVVNVVVIFIDLLFGFDRLRIFFMNLKICSFIFVYEFVSIGLFLNEEVVRSLFIGIFENGVEEFGKCWILCWDWGGVFE